MNSDIHEYTIRRIRPPSRRYRGCLVAWTLIVVGIGGTAFGQTLTRISGNAESTRPSISADGRFVAFQSDADNLVPDDSPAFDSVSCPTCTGVQDIFVYDRVTDATVRVSVGPGGVEADGKSGRPSISGDGRFVAFYSDATNLIIETDPNGKRDIFVHDRDPDENGVFDENNGFTMLASGVAAGTRGNGSSNMPSISADGRYVAFRTRATNLVPDGNTLDDILVRDLTTGSTVRVNVSSAGAPASDGISDRPSISADGRFVAFFSDAGNLVDGDAPPSGPPPCSGCTGVRDIFVHDRDPDENGVFDEGNGTTTRVSVSSTGTAGNGPSTRPAISADGRYVAFKSEATNLVSGDTNNADDVFLYDRQTGTTERVSVGAGNTQGNGDSSVPAISADGRFVAFRSVATNLVAGFAASLIKQVYILDRNNGVLLPVSTDGSGLAGNNDSSRPTISDDGRIVAFHSDAFSLVTDDTNGASDVFVRDLDSDGDSFFEGVDNCATVANTDQADLDSDGLGDVCDEDRDGDGTLNASDDCPDDPEKRATGSCGCGVADTDSDDDGTADCKDECKDDPDKTAPGECGCGAVDNEVGGSVVCEDACPDDPDKVAPGECGCAVADTDSDDDGTADCDDECPNDAAKTAPGVCGCGVPDTDSDDDGTANCDDGCPNDPAKVDPGDCGCGTSEADGDGDGVPDCEDNCVNDTNADQEDGDADGVGDACDNCPAAENADQGDDDGDGVGDVCQTPDGETSPPGDGTDGGSDAGAPIPGDTGADQAPAPASQGRRPPSACGLFGMLMFPLTSLSLLAMRRRR